MNTLAILQARFSSARLPGKVLKPIMGKPMLALQIERVLRSKLIDQLIVATSTDPSDDAIESLCQQTGTPCFRGSLNDVLDRFYQSALLWTPTHIVRLTGDCPLIDPDVIDTVIQFYLCGGYDYVSNALQPTFPDGLDVEIFRFECLKDAWKDAKLPSQREHVTPFIYQQTDRFRIGSFKNIDDLSGLRWTVDESADFELITRIYEALYTINQAFATKDILEFLDEHPELKTQNVHHQRNEGLKKSLDKDAMFIKNQQENNNA